MLWWLHTTVISKCENEPWKSVSQHRLSAHPFPLSRWLLFQRFLPELSYIQPSIHSLSLTSCHVVEAAGNKNEMLKTSAIYISAKLRTWQGNGVREVEEQQVFPFRYLSARCHRDDQILSTRPRPSGNSLNGLVSWQENTTLCLTTPLQWG